MRSDQLRESPAATPKSNDAANKKIVAAKLLRSRDLCSAAPLRPELLAAINMHLDLVKPWKTVMKAQETWVEGYSTYNKRRKAGSFFYCNSNYTCNLSLL